MKRVALSLFAAALFSLTSARPAAAAPENASGPYVFDAIDAVNLDGGSGPPNERALTFEGILVGEAAVREIRFVFNNLEFANRCHKHALIMLDKPGRYTLELRPTSQYTVCKLKRREP